LAARISMQTCLEKARAQRGIVYKTRTEADASLTAVQGDTAN